MIIVVLLLGFILRIISLNQSLWLDEAINVLAAQKYSLWLMITEYAKADFHPPGFFIILWFWTKLFGIGEISVRVPSVIFGVLTICVVYLIGKKLHSNSLGLLTALLLSINPLHIYYSQEARMYAFATLAVAINIYLLIKLLKEEKLNLIFLVISNLLIFSSDYVAYLIFPSQFIFLLFLKRKKIIKRWLTGFLIALLCGIWWVPIFLNQLSVGSVTSANLPAWKFIVGEFDIKTLPLTLVKFIIGRINLTDKFIYYILLVPTCSLFLFLLLKGIRHIKGDNRNLLVTWIGIPIILATLTSFVVPIYSYFRLIFTLPAFLILIALGVLSFHSKFKFILLGLVLLIEVISASIYLFNNSYQREDWKGLVGFLKTIDYQSQVYFESSGSFAPFDYYANNSINAKVALKDFPAKTQNDLIDFEADSKNVKHIFLIEYLVDISDPNRLVTKEFTRLGYKQLEIRNFTGVGFVYHYIRD